MVTKGKVQVGPLRQRKWGVVNLFSEVPFQKCTTNADASHNGCDGLKKHKETVFQRHNGDDFHLKEVTFILSGQWTGVELPSLILALLVDHSEDCRAAMRCTTRDAGTGRCWGLLACCICLACTDRSEETVLLAWNKLHVTEEQF